MEVIRQTNRSMLCEEINPEKWDLLSIIGDVSGRDSLSDEEIKRLNEELLCKSFDEFIEKFDPCVYSYFNAYNNKVMYVRKKPETIPDELLQVIHINKFNDYFNMLCTLIDTKRSQGLMNVDFKFDKITDMIAPKKIMDDIRQMRKNIRFVYTDYQALEDGDPHKLDVADKLNVLFEEASVNYNNIMAMLPLAIEDIKTRLLLGDANANGKRDPLTLGVLSMNEQGELKILEAPKQDTNALAVIDDNVNSGLIEAFREDYRAVNTDEQNSYVESLVVRTFCPLPSTMVSDIDVAQEIANYNSYLEFYKTAKDDFIKVVKPLIERVLGVKEFFDQYPAKLRGGMRPSLLVTNVSNEMLAKSNNIPSLITYLNTVNAKNDFANTVWFSIIPNVSLDINSKMKIRRERFKGNEQKENLDVNSMESLTRILDVFKDYRVMCFFSYETTDKTTFSYMATEGIDHFVDRCQPLVDKPYSEFAVPCIPNFTIVPKEKSGVILDRKMQLGENDMAEISKAKEDIMKLWIDGVYISAAYVAAGIVAAYQCPEYLKKVFKRKVDTLLPGVRFDIESGDNALKMRTTLAKEITGFTNSIKENINRRNFGFVFSSENAVVDGFAVDTIMVYKARNLMFNGQVYEPIYRTQVTSYIERVMRHGTSDFKTDNIVSFFSNNPASQKSRWMEKREMVNAIIAPGDDIDYIIEDEDGICTLNITFGADNRRLALEINRLAAARKKA